MSDKNTQAHTMGEPTSDRPTLRPPVDIFHDSDAYVILADLPGVAREALTIDLDGDRLTLLGQRGDIDYRRVFSVPEHIDPDKIEAELSAGVLRLKLPRHERTKPRRISVKAG